MTFFNIDTTLDNLVPSQTTFQIIAVKLHLLFSRLLQQLCNNVNQRFIKTVWNR